MNTNYELQKIRNEVRTLTDFIFQESELPTPLTSIIDNFHPYTDREHYKLKDDAIAYPVLRSLKD
jgi:hypothetical protein